ncbi:ATP-dependent nuclease [Velocimicrobium porci]|uniref:AAA family ATPase n=1 Tax=Velocimicrobium porci TaxID=2606634 RepID=A0A6L5XWD3_9FIRM|nr:AAA family ATPase [Velocimicrobium porci]MSS63135.1 AAA family ATPase [Velocimicrobium porci]
MKIGYLHIKNFKSIRDLEISDVENALILVGKNNTGKTAVIDAIRVVSGDYQIEKKDYRTDEKSISIEMRVFFDEEDLALFHRKGIVSKYKKFDLWKKDFMIKLPSFQNGELAFTCIVNPAGDMKYNDGYKKNNPYIRAVFPKIYHIDQQRNLDSIQNEVFRFYDKASLSNLRENVCIFDQTRKCNRCFNCIGVINKKSPEELTVFETTRLLEYKLFHMNINQFSDKLNRYFHANGSPSSDIKFEVNFDVDHMFQIETKVYNRERETVGTMNTLSAGLRSIYTLSLLEAYVDEENTIPCIIMIEDPEIYLHPQLQKTASEILLRLSRKNQVIFSTHSPNMIVNFSSKQIRQVVLDKEYYTTIKEETDIDEILDDLGYTANDFMNVSFVFIVEGKQDESRLPLLLEKYYSEILDDDGKLQRISIIPTNSCTNIKTYANLKYINQLYLKDQFLMIRDGDGKNPEQLKRQLCGYYKQREKEDVGHLPRVMPRNVLILKYYSFENYFLDASVMAKIGIVKNEEEFYNILYAKYKEYLYKLASTKHMMEETGVQIKSKQDLKDNMELIKIYVRGHNLFDIFYGKYRHKGEKEILQKYIDVAPREVFKDILDAIDCFIYFENRKRGNKG